MCYYYKLFLYIPSILKILYSLSIHGYNYILHGNCGDYSCEVRSLKRLMNVHALNQEAMYDRVGSPERRG